MGIEKMTLIDMSGNTAYLDRVLILCLQSGVFHPEYASKLSEYSIGQNPLLRNPYGGLLVKSTEIAAALGISPSYADFGGIEPGEGDREAFLGRAGELLDAMRAEYPELYAEQRRVRDGIVAYTSAVEMLAHVEEKGINFDRLWENRFLKVAFGRLPTVNVPKLRDTPDTPYELVRLDEGAGFTWCLYFTATEYGEEIGKMFRACGFERLHVPDFVHGTAGEALSQIRTGLSEERDKLEQSRVRIEGYVAERRETLLALYSRIKFLQEAYELRRYAVSIRDHFHLVGFVPARDKEEFLALLKGVPEVAIKAEPAGTDPRLSVPVKLKNSPFTRAFEMFIEMYGAPSYQDMDPTPFVAYTYTILFGIMFGDLGHGLCVLLLGFYLWKRKGMALGRVLQRVGISSMFFGFWYGSVFGFEHLLDPVFRALGFHEKPIEVMRPDTMNKILVAAVLLGVIIILSSILFNVVIGLKKRDYERVFLSPNGVCGFLFYGSALAGALASVVGGMTLPWWYGLFLIALPLCFIFFREPISKWAHMVKSESEIHHDAQLSESTILEQQDFNIAELFHSQFMTARFGRIPTDSYQKLNFYAGEPFMLYPVKTDTEYIWLIYATSALDKDRIDAIFHDLYFERIRIPEEEMETPASAAAFVRRCVDEGGHPREDLAVPKPGSSGAEFGRNGKTLYRRLYPDGFGAFFVETFFEMFEVILSFISNTVSFLRVGGFVLVHAGMMSVVFTMAGMLGGSGSVAVLIGGNLFVMVLEGLLVGIQVLRLEFYEMFSRFYGATGEPFQPAHVDYVPQK